MKVLLLGSGGREHALAWKIAQSPKVEKLYIAPGNAGTSEAGENVNLKATDFPALKAFALEKEIDMIVVSFLRASTHPSEKEESCFQGDKGKEYR